MKKSKTALLIAFLLLANAKLGLSAVLIEDVFTPSGVSESIVAKFAIAGSGTTVNLYNKFVRLEVSGMGTAEFNQLNDAFYFNGGATTQFTVGNRGMNISFTGNAQQVEADGIDVMHYIAFIQGVGFSYGGRPSYNPLHTYDFVIDIGDALQKITLGTGDGGVFDNTGQFNVNVTQLQLKTDSDTAIPEPAISMLLIIALSLSVTFFPRKRIS